MDLYTFMNSMIPRNDCQERVRVRRGSAVQTAEINIRRVFGPIQHREALRHADRGFGGNDRQIDRRVAESSAGEPVLRPRAHNGEQRWSVRDGERARRALRGIETGQNAGKAGRGLIANSMKRPLWIVRVVSESVTTERYNCYDKKFVE